MDKGIVYRSTGSIYSVKNDEGKFYSCRIKGKFRIQGIKSTNPVAVGDRVHFDLVEGEDDSQAVITSIAARDNYIIRRSVNLSKQTHIIASNIDQVFLLITLNNPPTFFAFIDRFLITAEAYKIPAVLLFNKMDTYSDNEKKEITAMQSIYEKIGYPCHCISSFDKNDVKLVFGMMQNKCSMFVGRSGVGKSTLLNSISPNLNLKTKVISEYHQQGQHTTTYAEMFDLNENTQIIDTPGIKSFGIVDVAPEELKGYFSEFLKAKPFCKFNNCLHIDEPKCAVKEGVNNGDIALSRYKNYLQILKEDKSYRKN